MTLGSEINPAKNLYDVAREVCHKHDLPWTDPRTLITYPPPPMKAPKKFLAHEFRRFRRKFWLSQRQLAEAMGVSRYFVSDVERCKYENVRPNYIRKFYMVKNRYEAERTSQAATALHLS